MPATIRHAKLVRNKLTKTVVSTADTGRETMFELLLIFEPYFLPARDLYRSEG